MRQLTGFLLLVVGVVLFLHGYTTSDSILYEFLELLTGPASDNSAAYLLGGALMVLLGLSLTLRGDRPRRQASRAF